MASRLALRTIALGYLAALLLAPLAIVGYRTFEHGFGSAWAAVTTPEALHAFWLTILIAGIAVPANTVFGVLCALAIVRKPFRGKGILNAVVDLPLALSPVVVGLALILVYARGGWFGEAFLDRGIEIVFALPGMILATIFVSLPFVVREVVPVLREVGIDQDEAAWTLGASRTQAFWRITLPAIRWGVAYGVVLTTARALGEYGAVAVVSGRLAGQTETLTIHVDEQYLRFNEVAAYTTALVLALLLFVLAPGAAYGATGGLAARDVSAPMISSLSRT